MLPRKSLHWATLLALFYQTTQAEPTTMSAVTEQTVQQLGSWALVGPDSSRVFASNYRQLLPMARQGRVPLCSQPLYTGTVQESTPVGTSVLSIQASDPDSQTITFRLVDSTFGRFRVDSSTGDVIVDGTLGRGVQTYSSTSSQYTNTGGYNNRYSKGGYTTNQVPAPTYQQRPQKFNRPYGRLVRPKSALEFRVRATDSEGLVSVLIFNRCLAVLFFGRR